MVAPPIYDLVNLYVLRAIPNGGAATWVLTAAAASHLVLRDVRKLRRGVLHPIRFAGRFVRGALGYVVAIGIVWAVVAYGKTAVLQPDSGSGAAASPRHSERSAK